MSPSVETLKKIRTFVRVATRPDNMRALVDLMDGEALISDLEEDFPDMKLAELRKVNLVKGDRRGCHKVVSLANAQALDFVKWCCLTKFY